MSMPGSSVKEWRAFLSVTADENGNPVNAIDRIGEGPWYDRIGRMLVPTKADLLNARPENGDIAIRDDLPNEWGIPNHQPDPNLPEVDNHHMLTGSDENGVLYSTSATCQDWTTDDGAAANGEPRCGLSWPRTVGGGRPGGGGGGTGGTHWISALSAPGCAPGIELEQNGGAAPGDISVGAGGGYGGFYCFALTP